jgi:DNA-binding Xre family transcriptional regulator
MDNRVTLNDLHELGLKYNKMELILMEKKVTKKELAKLLGITVSALQKKLNGHVTFNNLQINIILEKLNLKYEEFFL